MLLVLCLSGEFWGVFTHLYVGTYIKNLMTSAYGNLDLNLTDNSKISTVAFNRSYLAWHKKKWQFLWENFKLNEAY